MSVFNISGLASGIDTEDIVKKLMDIEKKPLLNLQSEQKTINSKLPIMQDINFKLIGLKSIMKDLTYETPFATKKISSSATAVSASIYGPGAQDGSYVIDSVSKIATATVASSQGSIGANIDVNEKISTAIKKTVTAGSFSINNHSFYIDPETDTVSDVINDINLQTANTGVTASYDSATDKLVLSNAEPGNKNSIIIGAAGDASNFLSVAGLSEAFQDTSSGVTKVSSTGHLGAIDAAKMMSEVNFDRVFVAGKIKINGVEINIGSADNLNDVLSRITNSSAGVTATYDQATDKIKLNSKATGKSYIKIEEVAGGSNFLELTGLIGVKSGSSAASSPGAITLASSLDDAGFKTALSGAGILQIGHGGTTRDITYDSSTTVQELIDSINAAGLNVTAGFNSDSGKFYIKPASNSDPNITISEAGGGNLISVLNLDSIAQSQAIGENAEYKIGGVTYFSNTNTITDKFKDVSFTLSAVTATAVSLTVTNDANTAKESIKKFVEAYNELLVELDKQLKDEEGPLYKDSSLRDILDGLKKSVNKYVSNGTNFRGLSDIGISTGALGMVFTEDYIGKLEIDEKALESALSSNPSEVRKLFAYDPDGGNKYTDGVAFNFSAYLESLTKADGTINKIVEVTNKELQRVTTSILDWNSRMNSIEKSLYEKFNSMEVMIGQLKRQGEALSQQLAQLG